MDKSFYHPSQEHLVKLSHSWCASFSGGKDSTSLVTWIEYLRRSGWLSVERPSLVLSDTGVEDELLNRLAMKMIDLLRGCGWLCAVVRPLIYERLYNRILGIGVPPVHPGIRRMRWCTRSTKIDPMNRWRKENADGLVLTGLRLGESAIRDDKIKKSYCAAGGECGIPESSEETYSPILHWSFCQVVDWLNGSVDKAIRALMADVFLLTRELVGIYGCKKGTAAFAEFGEPEIHASRFGCMGCPAIQAERVAHKSVAIRYGNNAPIGELYSVWFEARLPVNRCYNPRRVRNKNKTSGYGPIRMSCRKRLFGAVMDIQRRAGVVLIAPEDEQFIRECWDKKIYPRGWSEADEATSPPSDTPLFDGLQIETA